MKAICRNCFRCGIVTAAALVSLVGCARIPTVLPPDALVKMERTHVRSYMPQSEIVVQYMPSGYGGGFGLIGAIVDLSVNSAMAGNAESRAQKLRETVHDLDVRDAYWTAITNALTDTDWLKLTQIDLHVANPAGMSAEDVADHSAVTIASSYAISPDTRVLQMTTGLDVYIPGKHKKPAASVVMTSHSPQVTSDEGDKALAVWMADNGAAYRRAVKEAIDENVRMLRLSLTLMGGVTNTTHRATNLRAKLVHGRAEFGIPTGRNSLVGAVIDESPTRVVFRTKDGMLYSFPKAEVELDLPPNKPAKSPGGSQRAIR